MTIELKEIYAGLEAWRNERKITADSQKDGYIVNVMEELGELAEALRDLEKLENGEVVFKKRIIGNHILIEQISLDEADYAVIDALCDIAVFTINAGADIDDKPDFIGTKPCYTLPWLVCHIGEYGMDSDYFINVITCCASLCEKYGFNFEIAMLETIKEISSRSGSYDENAKKWLKDESSEARLNWYDADYEKARILK